MFILTDNNNKILVIGNKVEYMDGYPYFVEENTIYQFDDAVVHEIESIPEGVVAEKYCYDENQGFYENANYAPPNEYGIPATMYDSIIQDGYDNAILDLIEQGVL